MLYVSRNPAEDAVADPYAMGAWRDLAADRAPAALAAAGYDTALIPRPEAYPNASFLTPARFGGGGAVVHLSFRSLARLNLVKGAVNIGVWPWRYPSLSRLFAPGQDVRSNALHMLSLLDGVLCPSQASVDLLRAVGAPEPHLAPAPIPEAAPGAAPDPAALRDVAGRLLDVRRHDPREQRALSLAAFARGEHLPRAADAPRLFVAVADPDDPMAGLEPMLRGFAAAARETEEPAPPAVLALVLALDPARRAARAPQEWGPKVLRARCADPADLCSDAVLVVSAPLREAALAALFERADFFLTTSAGADQHSALQAAMAQGAAPIAPTGVAAALGLGPDTALTMATAPAVVPIGRDAARDPCDPAARAPYPLTPEADVAVSLPTARAVAAACLAARRLAADAQQRLSAAARAHAAARYRPSAIGAQWASAIETIVAAAR